MRTKARWFSNLAATALGAAILGSGVGCGKTVSLGNGSTPAKNPNPSAPQCGAGQTAYWNFIQPDPTLNRVVDQLFVVDTSPSMDTKRARIADTIPDFIGQLTPGTDYRIGVMLAHGGSSYYSGRLYSAHASNPAVLSSTTMSVSDIQAALKDDLQNVVADTDEANGEAGMYSVMHSLETQHLADIQAQGFYRSNAALSVVFVTDENDICYPPELNGYTTFPDFVPSIGGIERIAFNKYCLKSGWTASNWPDKVYSNLVSFKGALPLTLGGIVHVDPAQVPQGPGLEDAIGHGIIELAHKSANGVLIDITAPSFAAGLSQLGNVVESTLQLDTRFALDGTQALVASSVVVTVDGKSVASLFDMDSRAVEIAIADAGKSRSVVQVAACVASSVSL